MIFNGSVSDRIKTQSAGRAKAPILFLDARAELGGDGVVLLDMLRSLIPDDREVRIALPVQGELPEQVRALVAAHPQRFKLLALGFGYGSSPLSRLAGALTTVTALFALITGAPRPILHSNNTRRSLAFALILWALSLGRLCWVIHGHCGPQPGLVHSLAFRLCDRIWAVSQATAEEFYQAGYSQAQVLLNGSSAFDKSPCPKAQRSWAESLKLEPDQQNIAIFGRLTPHKGQALAIEAFLQWQALSPTKARLWVIGDDAIADNNKNYLSSLRERVRAANAAEKILFLGFQRDIQPLLSLASLVLVPSAEESFGLTALEAIAAKRPILATGPKGLGEVLRSLSIPALERSAEAFASAFDGALSATPGELAVRAARARELYGLNAFGQRLQRALAELDTRPARSPAQTLQMTQRELTVAR